MTHDELERQTKQLRALNAEIEGARSALIAAMEKLARQLSQDVKALKGAPDHYVHPSYVGEKGNEVDHLATRLHTLREVRAEARGTSPWGGPTDDDWARLAAREKKEGTP
jgi:phage shock protein A